MKCQISSNDSWEWLFLISPKKGRIIQGKEIIRGRQCFQILLTGSSTLNILFYYPIKFFKKKIMSNKLNMSFLSVSNLVPCLIFSVISLVSELESSLVSFAGADSTSTWRGGDKRKRGWQEGKGWMIIWRRRLFSIFPSKGSDYLREAINQGTAIIGGNTVVCQLNYKSSFFEHGRPIVLIVFRFIF